MFRAIHAPRSRAKGLTESTQRRLAGPVLTELTTQSPGHTHTHTHTHTQLHNKGKHHKLLTSILSISNKEKRPLH